MRETTLSWNALVLLAAGAEAGSPELEREAERVRRVLEWDGPAESAHLVRAARSQEVVAALVEIDPVLVHLCGPGGDLLLDGHAVSEEELAGLFARAGVATECVLLNAYYTPGRADALLDHVRCVIGSPGSDLDAAAFWSGFYGGLVRGEGWAAAFERGRGEAAAAGTSREPPRFASLDAEIFDPERGRPRRAVRPLHAPSFGTKRGLGPRGGLEGAATGGGTGGGPPGAPNGGAEAGGATLYPLWFGTNRAPVDPNDPGQGFSGERDSELHYGTCSVAVPRSHRIGSVGSSWWRRLVRREDDRLRLDRATLRALAADAFWADLAQTLAARDAGERMGLVVIHGYNVSFEAAALRAAQLGFDLQVPGATAFFSWPSRARLARYNADEATIQASEKHIARFLLEFTRQSGAEAVHVIAHSMGNRGLLRAMQRLLAEVGEETRVPFGQVLLAAPDEDQEVFAELSAAYRRLARRTTLYVSARDRAVASSQLVHDAPRVGFTPPVTVVPGIDTVEVTNADVSLLGHGYFAEARDLLHDIHSLLLHDAPPDRRMGLRAAATPDGRGYWVIGG